MTPAEDTPAFDSALVAAHVPVCGAAGEDVRGANIAGCGEALLAAAFAKQHGGTVLFVARSPLSAHHLIEELDFLAPALPVWHLPDWETLPYDSYSPTADNTSQRISALAALLEGRAGIVVTTAAAALLPCPPPSHIAARAFSLQVGERLQLSTLQERLGQGGYLRVDRVLAPGEYALYGGQIDIYPPDAKRPLRLVLADDEIEQIRLFDPESQRSVERVDTFAALPMSECDLSDEGRALFAAHYQALLPDDRAGVCARVKEGERVAGIEYYLPLFYERQATLFEYLPPSAAILAHDDCEQAIEAFLHQARVRQKIVSTYENRPVIPVSSLLMKQAAFNDALRTRPLALLETSAAATRPPKLSINARAEQPHAKLIEFINTHPGKIMLALDGEGRCDSLAAALAGAGITPRRCHSFAECLGERLSITVAPLRGGAVLPDAGVAIITESEIFQTALPPRARRAAHAASGLHIDEIRDGDYVAHRTYGVGKSRGLKNMEVGGEIGEYLELEYADTQRLFLPVGQLHLLERHHGVEKLSKMGSRGWKRVAARAARHAHDAAARLLDINARRAAATVTPLAPDAALLSTFINAFTHPETPDQKRAADEVLADMAGTTPMDRLVAADVGFGKTEVAMRAAAAAVFAGAQVAVLAPTTLLAQQHFDTFTERFAGFPVKIALLSRTVTAAAKRTLTARLAAGDVDIVIGTHALLNNSITYKNLGLLVIDEEHRFGVAHKEKFKNKRAGVDILSLSATPIPRTLAMALGGVRELSIISTPPATRVQVQTIQAPYSHAIVVEGCERELLRGGQVFFIHNEISTLGDMAAQLGKWLPQARILTAHGGMSGNALEDTMRRFLRRQGEILLCTTIVESGLDITNANTILINRADKMGLSRLHQLRGRVGRGSVQAYAYFLHPAGEDSEITRQAAARLAAVRDHAALGGGFFLSMRDLEIRGAGEILGERQSGDISEVGCALYQRMVNAAAKKLRGEPEVDIDISATIRLSSPSYLPDNYIPSPVERMRYYRRLAACTDGDALNDLFLEWEDRFGKPPLPAQVLKESHRLRLQMTACQVQSLRVNADGEMTLTFADSPACAAELMRQITIGACIPASQNAVKKKLQSEAVLAQTAEIAAFLRTLQQPSPASDTQKA